MGHVFVSHGSEDSGQANELAAFIESKGVKAWIAPRDVRPGQDYSEQLQEAIEQCIAFVVLVTDKANKSPYVRAETEMAFSTSKPIFPVRTSDIKPAAGLAFFLKIRHWTDAFGTDRDASLTRLARELQTLAGVAVDPAPHTTTPPVAAPESPVAPPPSPPPPPPQPAAPVSVAPTPVAPAPPAPSIADVDPALLEKAIGPKADWYIERWKAMEAKGSAMSWNWPACLANMFWFAYRKMWLPMFGVIVVMIALSLVGAAPALLKASWLASIAVTFVTGTFGNHLYKKHILKLIADTSHLGRPAQLEALESRGGVSKAALWISFAVVGLLALLIGLAAVGNELRRQQELNNMVGPTDNFVADPNLDPNMDKPPMPEEGQQPPPSDQQGY
jgi:hypothetical protein